MIASVLSVLMAGVIFTTEAAKRIADAVRQTERSLMNRPVQRRQAYRGLQFALGKTDAAHNKGASGTVSLYGGTLGSETDTGINITAFNKFGNVASGKWVMCMYLGNGWYIIAAEC